MNNEDTAPPAYSLIGDAESGPIHSSERRIQRLSSQSAGSGLPQSPIRLLRMHYLQKSALTRASEQFEEIAKAARRVFSIPDTIALNISAEVPSFGSERMLVDPEIWPVVCQEITAVWIVANHGQATAAAGSSGTSAQINHAPQGMPMSNILPNTMANTSEPASASFPGDRKERTIALKEFWGSDTLVLKVRGNVTIGDVKYAVYAQKPAYRTKGICIYHVSGGPSINDSLPVLEETYKYYALI